MPHPHFDFWVCQGRVCRGAGADDLVIALRKRVQGDNERRVRVLRGGCYGLCELSANVVVRRWSSADALPDPTVDRLQLSEGENETVYSQIRVGDVSALVDAHLIADQTLDSHTREAREQTSAPASPVAERMRALRQQKRSK